MNDFLDLFESSWNCVLAYSVLLVLLRGRRLAVSPVSHLSLFCVLCAAVPVVLTDLVGRVPWRPSSVVVVTDGRATVRLFFLPVQNLLRFYLPVSFQANWNFELISPVIQEVDGMTQFWSPISLADHCQAVAEEAFLGVQTVASLLELSCPSWRSDVLCLSRQRVLIKKNLLRNSNNLLFLTCLLVHVLKIKCGL